MLSNPETYRLAFKEPTVLYLRNFILDNNIPDTDSISLSQEMFDEIALDFRNTYKEPIHLPFIFLNVWITIADRGSIGRNQAIITKDDTPPEEVDNGPELPSIVYRCGYCGNYIDETGEALTGEPFRLAMLSWEKFGDIVFERAKGKCCKTQW